MAVIVKYIVVRNGEEKMTFATKKEADAYDKMLDVADNLFDFLETSEVELSEDQLETISLLLAENKTTLIQILKGAKPKETPKAKTRPETVQAPGEKTDKKTEKKSDKKTEKKSDKKPGPKSAKKPAAKKTVKKPAKRGMAAKKNK